MGRNPASRRRSFRDRWLPTLGVVLVAAATGWLAWREFVRPEATFWLRATGGRLPGPRQRIAEALARESARRGVRLQITECPGSIEALDEVNEGKVDLALVQGGLDSRHWDGVRLVTALHVEPLQLVVRGEIYPEVSASLAALRGRSINLGEDRSGSQALAIEVLAFVGLRRGDYQARTLSHEQLVAIGPDGPLPDAVMTVASLPTPMIRHLVAHRGYRLVPLPFGEAFALEDLFGNDATVVDPAGSRVLVDKVHIHPATIPAYTYGVGPAEPREPMPTIGARVLIVTNRKTDPAAVRRVLETVYLGEFSQIARPPLDASLLDLPPEFPLHPGTVDFQQRNKPLIFGDLLEYLEKTASFSSVVVGASFVTWQSARRRYRRRRELGFESYLLKVTAIERRALDLELSAGLDLGGLLALQSDLGRLKNEAMERFTHGELEGEGLMSGFLTHANDARDYLARLILHARSSIEKRARRQGIAPEVAWDDAIAGPDAEGRALPTDAPVL